MSKVHGEGGDGVAVTVDASDKPQHVPSNKKKYIILAAVVAVAIALALGLSLGLGLSASSSRTSDREQATSVWAWQITTASWQITLLGLGLAGNLRLGFDR